MEAQQFLMLFLESSILSWSAIITSDILLVMSNKRKRSSLIWFLSKKELIQLIESEKTYSSILRKLEYCVTGGNVQTLKQKIKEENINFCGGGDRKAFFPKIAPISLDKVLVRNSNYSRVSLKKKAFNRKFIKE